MAIRFYCVSCGQKIKAQDDMSGLKIACPTCNDRQTVPQPAPGTRPAAGPRADQQQLKLAAHFDPDDFTSAAKGYHHDRRNPLVDDHSEPLNKVKKKRILRGSLYFVFVLAFIPLFMMMLEPPEVSVLQRIENGIDQELKGETRKKARKAFEDAKKGRASLDDILSYFPNKKLKDAWLPRNSDKHIYLGLVCAIGFLFTVCICLPKGFTRIPIMLIIGGFTGVFGTGLLLIIQHMAITGWGLVLGGPFAIIFFMIGIAYRALLNPDLPFINCLVSFTFGVGLCEEIIKALPIFLIFMGRSRLRWHECCALGMASGIGFGIAEGIFYSGQMYNGLYGPMIYAVRFVSCVMLHAIWCAAAALFLHRFQKLSHGKMNMLIGFYKLVILISIPMFLHGLYDTLLTKNMDGLALTVALFSFGWLLLMVESAREKEGDVLVVVSTGSEEGTPLHNAADMVPDAQPERIAHATSPSPI